MLLAFVLAAQLTGYLPPAPPRNPITDPMFAGSPIRELRRQWDDCESDVKNLVFLNGITDGNKAAALVDACAEYEDPLTGALVNRYGFTRGNAAMTKAHEAAEAELRRFAVKVEAYLKSAPPPPPPKTPAQPPYRVEPNGVGCSAEYLTTNMGQERALGYYYDRSDGERLDTDGRLLFAFTDKSFAQSLASRRKAVRVSISTRSETGAINRVSEMVGQTWMNNGHTLVMVNMNTNLETALLTRATLKMIIINGPWGTEYEFNADHLGQMIGDVKNCARGEGAWQHKN